MNQAFRQGQRGLILLLLTVSGCSNYSESLGFGRTAPDEFAVYDRAPLSMPPDYQLRPPVLGAPRPQDSRASEIAAAHVFDSEKEDAEEGGHKTLSDAERKLLDLAGAKEREPNIRQTIDKETSEKIAADNKLIDDLLWWKEKEPSTPILDAETEAKRLRDAQKEGAPLNQKGTPVIEKRKSKILPF